MFAAGDKYGSILCCHPGLILVFQLQEEHGKHVLSTLNNKANRTTDVEAGKCPLLPSGSLGQLLCQLLGLVEG